MDLNICLDDIVLPNFRQAFIDVVNCNVQEAIFKGGRASIKSVDVSYMILVGCMTYNQSAICILKIARNIRDRLVNTFLDSIKRLGLQDFWKWRKSPDELVLLDEFGRETDVSIKFLGMDNPGNRKGVKPRSGNFRYIFIEEATDFESMLDIENIKATTMRGTSNNYDAMNQCLIMAYNPPLHKSNPINQAYNKPVGRALGYDTDYYYEDFEYEYNGKKEVFKRLIHHSTMYEVIKYGKRAWLGALVGIAERAKVENNRFWRWAYLGEVVGTEANVFWNLEDWDGDTSKLKINEVLRAMDWGEGGPDPCAYIEIYFDRVNRYLYILNEFGKPKMSIEEVAKSIKEFNRYNFRVWCDSATPILNQQLRNLGIDAQDVKKWPDSVQVGIKFLQSMNKIFICQHRTPNAYREFNNYEYELDKDNNVTSRLSDKDNHWIDGTRYALVLDIMNYQW